MPIEVVWFKRDLRLRDHKPLQVASQSKNPLFLMYLVEPERKSQPDTDDIHIEWEIDCALALDKNLRLIGGSLHIIHSNAIEILGKLDRTHGINRIFSHEETGTSWSYQRDMLVKDWCEQQEIQWIEFPSNGVVRGLESRDNWKASRDARMSEPLIEIPHNLTVIPAKENPDLTSMKLNPRPLKHRPVPGEDAAMSTIDSFLKERGELYRWRMSAPALATNHCSRLSPYFSAGCISIGRAVQMVSERQRQLKNEGLDPDSKSNWKKSLSSFQSRLAWHCHFIQKLEQEPTLDIRAMNHDLDSLMVREFDQKLYNAWATGNTGWPFFDACMRQLTSTGWINFRMRAMIMSVASYTLWLPWRKTGLHLARLFMDYEPGIHWSQVGMQSGTTGINTVRAYSILKQGKDHDKEGYFIKKWIPELRNVPSKYIHEPWKMPEEIQASASCLIGKDYPMPCTDEASARKEGVRRAYSARRNPDAKTTSRLVYQKHGSRKKSSRRTHKSQEHRSIQTKLF